MGPRPRRHGVGPRLHERRGPVHEGELVDLATVAAISALANAGDAEALADLIDDVGLDRSVPAALRVLLGPPPEKRPRVPLCLGDIPERAHRFLRAVASKIEARRDRDGGFYNDDALEAYGICCEIRQRPFRPMRWCLVKPACRSV